MNVLLINPTRTGEDSYISPPLHLVYIAGAIKRAGHSVKIADIHYRYAMNRNSVGSKVEFENEIIEEIGRMDFDLLGIGSIVSSFDFSKRLVNEIKRKRPDVPIIVGGGMSMALKDLWFDRTKVDFLVESDGELVIRDFLEFFPDRDSLAKIPGLHMRTNGGFVSKKKPNLPRNLDYIDYPDWSLLDNLGDYMDIQKRWINATLPAQLRLSDGDNVLPIVMTRGCPYHCTFCYHVNNLHRSHSVEYIVNYLRHLKEKYRVNFIQTWDDLIMANKQWLSELCDALSGQNLGMSIFTSGGKPNLVTGELLKKMKAAGFIRVSYGIESGSQKILNIMKKQTTVTQNYEAVKMTAEEGIFVHLNMVIGMPGEDMLTLKETSDFLTSLSKQGIITSKNVSFSYATGYPGTELYQYMLDKGMVTDTEAYLKSQTGVVDYKYNLCGMNINLLNYKINIALTKTDFFYNLSSGNYFKAAERFLKGITRSLAVLILPRTVKKFIKRIKRMIF